MAIELIGGGHALIDPDDAAKVAGFKWRAIPQNDREYVAATGVRCADGSRTTVSMGRLLTDAPRNMVVIHRNGDWFDFRGGNLELIGRDVLRAMSPVGIAEGNMTSRYRGVSKTRSGLWQVTCGRERIGTYHDEEEAARAYDDAATERYGDRAQRNFSNAA